MVTDYKALVLDFSDAAQIDTSAAMAISEMLQASSEQNIICILCGLNGEAERTLHSLGIIGSVPGDRVVELQEEAIRRARKLMGESI